MKIQNTFITFVGASNIQKYQANAVCTRSVNQTNSTISVSGVDISPGDSLLFDYSGTEKFQDVTIYEINIPAAATGSLVIVSSLIVR